MKRCASWVMLFAVCLIAFDPLAMSAQTFQTPKGEAQNVRFELRDEGESLASASDWVDRGVDRTERHTGHLLDGYRSDWRVHLDLRLQRHR